MKDKKPDLQNGLRKSLALVYAISFLICNTAAALAQDESLRGLFVKTRPAIKAAANEAANESHQAQAVAPETVAIGYTLFLRDKSGATARVSPAHRFNEGDRLRILIESNRAGHLYIFNREGQGPLRMIFPDLRIRRGNTAVEAHVPLQLPTDATGPGNDRDWFILTGPPQPESLFVVFARQPVSQWPASRDLLQHPAGFKIDWDSFVATVRPQAIKSKKHIFSDEGQPLSEGEQASLNRGMKLSRNDPAPSVVEAASGQTQAFVIEIELKRQ